MNKITNKIFAICDKCGRVELLNRAPHDPKEAIFVVLLCDRCDADTAREGTYYNKEGIIREEEGYEVEVKHKAVIFEIDDKTEAGEFIVDFLTDTLEIEDRKLFNKLFTITVKGNKGRN